MTETEEWVLSQCLALPIGSHVSFLPAVVCTLEKALNSYNSDTDPANPANPMPCCAPLACERQTWTSRTTGTHTLQKGGSHISWGPAKRGAVKTAAKGPAQPLCQEKNKLLRDPWKMLWFVSTHQKSLLVSAHQVWPTLNPTGLSNSFYTQPKSIRYSSHSNRVRKTFSFLLWPSISTTKHKYVLP